MVGGRRTGGRKVEEGLVFGGGEDRLGDAAGEVSRVRQEVARWAWRLKNKQRQAGDGDRRDRSRQMKDSGDCLAFCKAETDCRKTETGRAG